MRLIQDDCLEALKTIPDNSVDLILTDPPYYRVIKGKNWDNQWSSEAEFLTWLESVVIELKRVLRNNGSFYLFAGPHMAAKVEVMIGRHLRVLNHLVWSKKSGRHQGTCKEVLRQYFPQTERIIFAEQRHSEGERTRKDYDLQRALYRPIVDILNRARKAAGYSLKDCVKICGSTASHYFQLSQFHFPSEANYIKLMQAFGADNEYGSVRFQFEALRGEFNRLKEQYNDLRRTFTVTKHVPFTDVWHFDPTPAKPGRHPCEKPQALLEHVIQTSSQPGQVVLDAFMGTGSAGLACVSTGRDFIGIERDMDYFNEAEDRIIAAVASESEKQTYTLNENKSCTETPNASASKGKVASRTP